MHGGQGVIGAVRVSEGSGEPFDCREAGLVEVDLWDGLEIEI